MKVLFATNNPSKFKLYKSLLKDTDYEVKSLNDINVSTNVEETGHTPEENALIKARYYNKETNMITISDDTGLYLDNINDEDEPGIEVRRYKGKTLTDDEIIDRFVKLIKKNGGKINGKWKKAVAIVDTEEKEYTYSYEVQKIFTDKVNKKRHIGFPLDSITITPEFGKYTVEHTEEETNSLLNKNYDAVREFIISTLEIITKDLKI